MKGAEADQSSPAPDRDVSEEGLSNQPAQNLCDDDSGVSAHPAPEEFHIAPPIQGLYEPDPHAGPQGHVFDDNAGNEAPRRGPEQEATTGRPPFPGLRPEAQPPSKPSITRRLARIAIQGFVAIVTAGMVIAFLSGDRLRLTGGSIQSATRGVPSAGSATNQLNPVLQQQLALSQQIEKIVSDLSAVQQIVQRLATRQDDMEQTIASLRNSQQNLGQEVAALSQATAQNPKPHSRRHRRSAEKPLQSAPPKAPR
jgi:hypothetical protein